MRFTGINFFIHRPTETPPVKFYNLYKDNHPYRDINVRIGQIHNSINLFFDRAEDVIKFKNEFIQAYEAFLRNRRENA